MGCLRMAVAGWLVLASAVQAQTLPPEVQADRSQRGPRPDGPRFRVRADSAHRHPGLFPTTT